jgi:protein MAK11
MAPTTQKPFKRSRTGPASPRKTKETTESSAKYRKSAPPKQAGTARISSSNRKPEVKPAIVDKGKAKAEPQSESVLPSTFKVVAGSYEKLLYGLEGTVNSTESGVHEWKLKPIFIFPAHVSCIKAVAASPSGGKWLATGSSDEIIKVWDLRRRKEIGGLMHHEGE